MTGVSVTEGASCRQTVSSSEGYNAPEWKHSVHTAERFATHTGAAMTLTLHERYSQGIHDAASHKKKKNQEISQKNNTFSKRCRTHQLLHITLSFPLH